MLNASEQITSPLRFVYALRDSLFEIHSTPAGDPGENQMMRAASMRAKFFDLIIPVVPFATRRTALDLWERELRRQGVSLPVEVVALVATYIQDMRVIRSICYEFEVFAAARTVGNPLRLRDDSLLALMAFKAVHPAEFERIRSGDSCLDAVEALRREAIRATVEELDDRARRIASRGSYESDRHAQSAALGASLLSGLDRAFRIARGEMQPSFTLVIGDIAYSRDDATGLMFWWHLAQAPEGLFVDVEGQIAHVTADDLEAILGVTVTELRRVIPGRLQQPADEVSAIDTQRDRVASASLAELLRIDGVVGSANLESSIASALPSPLAVDLIIGGFIDQNFSLYASRYFGASSAPAVLNFAMHVAQPGIVDFDAPLNGREGAEALLREVGPQLLSTRSALNIALVDALLDDARLDPVLQRITSDAEDGHAFLRAYLLRGSRLPRLIELLVPRWPEFFEFVAASGDLPPAQINTLLDLGLRALSEESHYSVGPAVRSTLETSIGQLRALRDHEPSQAPALARFLRASGTTVPRLADLSIPLRQIVAGSGGFDFTVENFTTAFGADTSLWSLDLLPFRSTELSVQLITR